MKGFLLSVLLSVVFATAYSQSDTLFWFVAPTATSGHGNSPILFRIAGGTSASTVTIDMPANPGFTPIVQAVGANAGVSIDVTTHLAIFESTPSSTILNKGIRIRATSNISIYYEVNHGNNPEIYALKGDNALGTSFVTPFQNVFNNGAYTPTPKSAIDIVATEDGTVVTIVPSAAVEGGAAGVPITITLNKGQTYSVVQLTTTGAGNLSGTRITSNKRIAVTIKDDSLQFEGCMDLTGDQMVPTNIIGKEYIVVKGSLNVQDKVVIVPVSPGTNISINGTPMGTYSNTLVYNLTVPSIYIEASAPVYVYHYTGFGCELGSAIVPPIKCTGARTMSAVRSTNEYFGVVVFALTSTVSNFLVNGNNALLTSANFTIVPGTGGLYSSALVDFSGTIGTGTSINITNTVGLFHAGIINGGASSGCRYGFFSDYSRIVLSSEITKPISCFNGNDGAIMVEMLGGLAPYNYVWSNGQTTQTAVDLSQGIYKVVVTDASNCKDSILDTIAHPTIITGTVYPVDIINNCLPETSTGSAIVTATGGTPSYTYSLDSTNYQVANQFIGLAEGSYTALIKDTNGCIESVDFVILDPPNDNPIQASLITNSVVHNCIPNGTGGEAAISASGGYIPYTYSLNGGTFVVGNSFTGLSSGNNYIIARDANGCRDTVFFVINNPINNTQLTATVSPSNITHNCFVGINDGTAEVTINGGFTPYQTSLNGGVFTSNTTFNNLATGNYTIDILDSNGCTTTTTFTITNPPANAELAVSVLPSDIVHNCFNNGNDGTALATPTGGYAPYRYSIDGGTTQQPSPSFANLLSGTYTLTVTDTNNCTATTTFTITDPPSGIELTVAVLPSDIVHNCFNNGNDGTASATPTGGYAPYRYSIDGGTTQQPSPSFTNLLSGTYTLTVTDTNNCTATTTFTITDPPSGIELDVAVLPSDIVHNCFNNGNDGTALATPTGGYAPYRYSIDGGTTQQPSPSFANLLSGTYTLTVTDTNNCTATTTFVVTDPLAGIELAVAVLPSDIVHNCFNNAADGTALATTNGGYAPYRYSIDGGTTQQPSPSFANLLSGTYTLTVTDTNNCTATTTFTITDPPSGIELAVAVLPSDIVHNCLNNGNDGTALATPTGGYAPYRYSIDGGTTQQPSPSFTNLLSGTYTLTVTDTNNCTATTTFVVTDPPSGIELTVAVLPSDIVHNCLNNGTDGTALATTNGGYAPYRYSIDGGTTQQASPSFTNLLSGTYTLTVTDTNNCTATTTFTITDPPSGIELAVAVLPSDIVHNCLNNGNDGTALATPTGGYAPYRYSIDGGTTQQPSPSFTNLLSGTYTLTVTDMNNCTATTTFVVTDPPAATELSVTVNPTDIVHNCFNNGNDGTALATPTGGYAPYRYSIDGGTTQQSSPSFANLLSGTYTLTVTDTNNCTATTTFVVTDPPSGIELTVAVLPSDIVHNCFNNGNDGTALATPTGGYAPYRYSIDGGTTQQASPSFTNLLSGTYTLTVTDTNNCTATTTFTITDPPSGIELTVAVLPSDIVHNCFNNRNDGTALATPTGGYAPYRYSIDGGTTQQPSPSFTNLLSGTYTLTVTDTNNCTATTTFTITDPPAGIELDVAVLPSDIVHNCLNNGTEGTALATTNGGYAPYRYSIDGGTTQQPSPSFTNLLSGTYTLTVTDTNNCTATTTFVVTDPPSGIELTVAVLPSDIVHNCFNNGNDGTALATPTGGYAPYRYSIDGGTTQQASPSFTNLLSGTYTLTVTDTNNCTATTTFTITDPPSAIELAVAVLPTDIVHNCLNNGNDGTALATTNGGYAPYRYSIDGGTTQQPSPSFTNLLSGTYTLTVTDTNNCNATTTFVVTDPPSGIELTVAVLPSDIVHNCLNNGTDGTALATTNGGYAPYRYSIDGGTTQQPSPSFTNLPSGTYTLTVTDTNNCTATTTFMVTDPPSGIELTVAVLPSDIVHNCFINAADGTALATTNGGYAPYRYSIDGGTTQQPSPSFANLLSGTYTLTVTDTNNCTATTTFTITDPPSGIELTVAVLSSDIVHNCLNNGTDGTALATTNGGYAPYRYSIDGGTTQQPSPSFTNLLSGTYTLTVTDTNNCTATTTFTITDPPSGIELAVAVLPSDIVHNCFNNGNDGTASATPTGGYAPYRYSIDGGTTQQASPSFTNLLSGTYTLTVTDTNNCTATTTFVVTDPPAATELSVTVNPTDIVHNCFNNGNDGTALATPTGGYAPYRYSIDGGTTQQASPSFTNLLSGTYTLTVTDTNNCTATTTFVVTDPPAGVELDVTVNPSDIVHNCFNNAADGTALATPTGGYAPYRYSIDGGTTQQASPSFTNLLSGTYTLTVTDTNNCTATATFTITDPPSAIELAVTVNPSDIVHNCFNNAADGTALATTNGGYAPYRYSIDGGTTQQSSPSFVNLLSGTYTLTVTDTNNCTATTTFVVTDPPSGIELTVAVLPSDIVHNCFNNGTDGTALATPTGGYAPYRYSIDGGTTQQSSPSFVNLLSGTYTLIVTDTNNCTATTTFVVTDPPAATELSVTVNPTDIVHNCFNNGNDGTALATPTGGYAPYRYSIDGGTTQQASPSFTNLLSGTYTLTVTDTNNCTATTTFVVTDPPAGVELDVTVNPSDIVHNCFNNGTDGTALATTNGGYAPYRYSIDGGTTQQASPSFTNLLSGTYTLTVTDTNNCTATTTFVVTDPPAATELSVTVNPSDIVHNCFNNGTDGTALATTNGGYAPYRYSIDGGTTQQPSPSFTNLLSGTYTLTVTDTNNCTATTTFTITDPPSGIELDVTVNPSDIVNNCFNNGNDGTALATTNGGYAPYRYSIDGGTTQQPSSSFTNLLSGTYTLTVTDTNNCTATTTFTITDPAGGIELSATLDIDDISCHGLSDGAMNILPIGGYPPYTYLWNDGQTSSSISNLALGTYSATITDANGCQTNVSGTITQPSAALSVFGTHTDINCFGDSTGTITITVSGGTVGYQYLWSNGETTPNLTNVAAGTYSLSVTDANGCSETSFSANVLQPQAPLSANSVLAHVKCYQGNDGDIDLSVTGGTSPYQYQWNNGQNTEDIQSLLAGNYSVVIIDANGCTETHSATITQSTSHITSTATTFNPACNGASDGGIQFSLTGGEPGYTYSWSNGASSPNIGAVPAGTYTVTYSDNRGCTNTRNFLLVEPTAINVQGIIHDNLCSDNTNGSISVTASGGTPGYSYLWNSGLTQPNLINLGPGAYQVTVTDVNGCSVNASFSVFSPMPLEISVSSLESIFIGEDVLLSANVSGGTTPYQYSWTPEEHIVCPTCESTPARPVRNTNYFVYVTDANGCRINANVEVEVNQDIFIPNAFTPGASNGVNDMFKPVVRMAKECSFSIYNRWGEKIYSTKDIEAGWDGTLRGNLVKPDVYIYKVDVIFYNGEERTLEGHVTVVR